MQSTATRTTAALMSTALVVSVAGIVLSDRTASADGRSWTRSATELPTTSDTFVSRESPKQSAGSRTKLVVRNTPRVHKKAYLKFVVPKAVLRNGGQIESAVFRSHFLV